MLDYERMFNDRLLLIVGSGRSGTTILGNLIASMTPVYYLFEPIITKLMDVVENEDILFEDYFLPVIQGRNISFNPADWTYYKKTMTKDDLQRRWDRYPRRSDAITHVEQDRPLFVIKTLDNPDIIQNLIDRNYKLMHCIRNGSHVLKSSFDRDWYSDEYCEKYMLGQQWDWWQKIDQTTRCAFAWRDTTRELHEFSKGEPDRIIQFKYEDLCFTPGQYVNMFTEQFGIQPTDTTHKLIREIEVFSGRSAVEIDPIVDSIQEPEKEHFNELMMELGY